MRQKHTLIAVLAGMAAVLCAPPAGALDKCAASVKRTDGTIMVAAKHVYGNLLWGWSATTQIQEFYKYYTCINVAGTARNCTLGAAGTLLAMTPPPDCTLQLKDWGGGTCTALVKPCTPGKRPVVEFPIRFVDNGDGTVTDTRTGLMWEQKTADGSIHNTYDYYAWSTGSPYNPDGNAYFTFLATLNGPTPFAGYGDWRLPTLTELLTIVGMSVPHCGEPPPFGAACIDETVFGPTQTADYWSATTSAGTPDRARTVSFMLGALRDLSKPVGGYARAVRGPL